MDVAPIARWENFHPCPGKRFALTARRDGTLNLQEVPLAMIASRHLVVAGEDRVTFAPLVDTRSFRAAQFASCARQVKLLHKVICQKIIELRKLCTGALSKSKWRSRAQVCNLAFCGRRSTGTLQNVSRKILSQS